ncbi:histidine phosphatase family protein [Planktotalea sp.]|uniref:histidine phosphatase family protein n=1 Tax=Planktotalea sp. TaxID=2029877 RepID=UPI0032973F40
MQIIIMRHGQPELDLDDLKKIRMSARAVGDIVARYEQADLAADSEPSEAALELAQTCSRGFCSELPRAIGSIEKLGLSEKTTIDPDFTESALPFLTWARPNLTFFTWCILFRITWLFGFSQNGEHIRGAKTRAKRCAERLIADTKEDETTLLLGHGIMNRLIARELKRNGWRKIASSGENYWAISTYIR